MDPNADKCRSNTFHWHPRLSIRELSIWEHLTESVLITHMRGTVVGEKVSSNVVFRAKRCMQYVLANLHHVHTVYYRSIPPIRSTCAECERKVLIEQRLIKISLPESGSRGSLEVLCAVSRAVIGAFCAANLLPHAAVSRPERWKFNASKRNLFQFGFDSPDRTMQIWTFR